MAVVTTITATPLMYLVYPPKMILADDLKRHAAPLALPAATDPNTIATTDVSKAANGVTAAAVESSVLLCYKGKNEVMELLAVAALFNPTKQPLVLARLHLVNDRPSSFMNVSRFEAMEIPLVVRLRAIVLGQRCAPAALATPWYNNASEQIIESTRESTSLLMLPSSFPDCPVVVDRVLQSTPLGVIGVVHIPGSLDMEESRPFKRVFIAYNADTPEKQLFGAVRTLIQAASQLACLVTLLVSPAAQARVADALDALRCLLGVEVAVAAASDPVSFDRAARAAVTSPANSVEFDLVVCCATDLRNTATTLATLDTWAVATVHLLTLSNSARTLAPVAEVDEREIDADRDVMLAASRANSTTRSSAATITTTNLPNPISVNGDGHLAFPPPHRESDV
eukprot:m.49017 g.49017  ORF g.49017 m.49017 type:complete len:397 (-) comp11441_c1_seq1:37-1227(-)